MLQSIQTVWVDSEKTPEHRWPIRKQHGVPCSTGMVTIHVQNSNPTKPSAVIHSASFGTPQLERGTMTSHSSKTACSWLTNSGKSGHGGSSSGSSLPQSSKDSSVSSPRNDELKKKHSAGLVLLPMKIGCMHLLPQPKMRRRFCKNM